VDTQHSKLAAPHRFSTQHLTEKQKLKLKSSITDINLRLNQIIPSFDCFNQEFVPGARVIDIFPERFSFHSVKRTDSVHFNTLNKASMRLNYPHIKHLSSPMPASKTTWSWR